MADDFPGNRVACRRPEQEVQEEVPDQLPTGQRPGGPAWTLSSCCLHIPGREGRASEQLPEVAEHCFHLCLGSVISKVRD